MILIVCLDINNGISFNNRRQSRDSKVIERICSITKGSTLIMSEYSKNIFPTACSNLNINSNPIRTSKENDYCFIEQKLDSLPIEDIEKMIIYRWDKAYPYDEIFPINLSEFKLVSKNEFSGSSHEKITEEIYTK